VTGIRSGEAFRLSKWLYDRTNPDPGFTPGSTPDFAPGWESYTVSIERNKNTISHSSSW